LLEKIIFDAIVVVILFSEGGLEIWVPFLQDLVEIPERFWKLLLLLRRLCVLDGFGLA